MSDKLRLFTSFVVNFDTAHRNPKWVLEHISKKTISGGGNRCGQPGCGPCRARRVFLSSGLRFLAARRLGLLPPGALVCLVALQLAGTGACKLWKAAHPQRRIWRPPLSLPPCCRKNSEFFEDPAIEPRFRSKLANYRGSGFDRGHMAPASNHKASQQAMDETFCLSNMSPQVPSSACLLAWARLPCGSWQKGLLLRCRSTAAHPTRLCMPAVTGSSTAGFQSLARCARRQPSPSEALEPTCNSWDLFCATSAASCCSAGLPQ